MKIKLNKEAICSLLLTGSIVLSVNGCTRQIEKNKANKENKIEVTSEETQVREKTYINKYGKEIDLAELNTAAYILNEAAGKYTLCAGANIYFINEWNIDFEEVIDRSLMVDVVSSSDKYTVVKLPNGESGYVENGYLVKCANVNVTEYTYFDTEDRTLATDAYLYNNAGMYIGYLHAGDTVKLNASNFEYSYVTLNDGTSGYVLDKALTGNYQTINGMAFIPQGTRVYSDKKLTKLWRISGDEAVYVEYIANKYAAIYDTVDNTMYYVAPNAFRDDFVLVDLDSQRMECYLDYQLAGAWGTRSGRDGSPTHTGAYDIDEKITDWEFTTYPGSYAKYWIPISPVTQEGIHDLVGDDEQNYGNEAYHTHGSHGCIRVPKEASKFVYDNYEVGDMVLVRKK